MAPIQKYIPLEQITDPASSFDGLKSIVESPSKGALELNSEKSGLKLTFDSNRMHFPFPILLFFDLPTDTMCRIRIAVLQLQLPRPQCPAEEDTRRQWEVE